MRLTTVLLIASFMQLSAATLAQKVTLNKTNAPLKTILRELKAQSGYIFLYRDNVLKESKPVNISIKNADINEALEQIFKDQPLSYSLNEKTITIKEKESSFLGTIVDRINHYLTAITVTGKVVDENGQPIGGASVVVKSTGKGVTTRADGKFKLLEIEENSTLLVKFIGYETKEFSATKDVGVLKLKTSTSELDAVQIQAYGITSKRLTTSNITTIRAEDIEKQPVSNPLLALQGRVPGLVITPISGFSGGTVTVRIQGYNSIRGGNNPFYVVDGVPYNSSIIAPSTTMNSIWGAPEQLYGSLPQLSGESSGNPLNYINPADIESIEILKDADATAIYGSKAANGAIIITTKKGKAGPMKIDATIKSGFDNIVATPNFLSYEEYRQLRLEARKNANQSILATDYDLNGVWGSDILNRDYQKMLLNKSVSNHNAQISATGGGVDANYRINIGYQKLNGVFGDNLNDEKVSLGVNLNTISLNRKFTIGLALMGMIDNNRLPSENPITSILVLPPNSPALYNSNGTLNWALDASGNSTWDNPLARLERTVNSKVKNFNSNINLSYELLPNLKLSSNVGYNIQEMENFEKWPVTYSQPSQANPLNRQVTKDNLHASSYIIEPQLTFIQQLGSYKADFLLGGTIQSSTNTGIGIKAYGFPSDAQMDNLAIATGTVQNGTVSRLYRYNAGFFRLNINRNDEFLLNLTARRDGSSRFGDNNRFQNFAAIGAGWVFTERKWLKDNLAFMSFGKLRLSYGVTGSDQIGDYTYLDLFRAYTTNINYQDVSVISNSGVYNADLQWEKNRKLNIGLDLYFLKNRLQLTGNYAINRSDNLLMSVGLPTTALVGINSSTSVNLNFPGLIQNKSLELSLLTRNIERDNFSWQTLINFTHTSNILKSIGDPTLLNGGLFDLAIGQSVRSKFVRHYSGIDPLTGTIRISDLNGNPSSAFGANEDKSRYIDLIPDYSGGVSNTVRFKNLSLDFLIQYQSQNRERYLPPTNYGNDKSNVPVIVNDRWRNPGDVATMVKAGPFNQTYIGLFDGSYEDASFIRVKNVALSWDLPRNWVQVAGLRKLRLMCQMQNLWTISKYSGLDPETGASFLPLPRTIVFGLNVGF